MVAVWMVLVALHITSMQTHADEMFQGFRLFDLPRQSTESRTVDVRLTDGYALIYSAGTTLTLHKISYENFDRMHFGVSKASNSFLVLDHSGLLPEEDGRLILGLSRQRNVEFLQHLVARTGKKIHPVKNFSLPNYKIGPPRQTVQIANQANLDEADWVEKGNDSDQPSPSELFEVSADGTEDAWVKSLAAGEPWDITSFCNAQVGKRFYLKVPVVRIQHIIGGIDATNIYPTGQVYYRATFGGFRQVQSTSAEDFAEEVRMVAQASAKDPIATAFKSTVRVWGRGSHVTIHKVSRLWNEIEIDVTEEGGSKSRIRFKFNQEMNKFRLPTVKEMFLFTFAESEADLSGVVETVKFSQGMSPEEIRVLKGNPKSEVDLGARIILIYGDLKFVFEDSGLVDVQ